MSPHKSLGAFDADAVARMLRFMASGNGTILLTNGSGAIGGVMAPVYFATWVLMAEESFWWASANGMELLDAFETEAKAMGARFVLLSTLENERSAVIDRIVRRKGYTTVERRHMKELV